MNKPKIGILLSGCGVYDGAEIHESVLTMLVTEEFGYEAVMIGIDAEQHHVINHLNGEEMPEKRNMLVEAARIARGEISEIRKVQPADLDALVIPGGFGSAKNFTDWAFKGPNGTILPEVKLLLVNMINVGKPIVALCVSPVVLAKAFEDSALNISVTIGSENDKSPYNISEFNAGLSETGLQVFDKTVHEIHIDPIHKIITAPCYMMEAGISEIYTNIRLAFTELKKHL